MEATKTYKDFQKVAQTHMCEIPNHWWPKKAEAQLTAKTRDSDEVPSRGEIKAFLSQMNNKKAPGMDGITTEILKNGSEKMIDLLEQVIQSVWESEVPQDWRDVILVSLYKKGLKSDCSNFRGISLLSIVGKLF